MEDMIVYENGVQYLSGETVTALVGYQQRIRQLQEEEKKLKAALMAEMARKKIYKVESERVALTLIAPTTKETFDSKRFRNDYPGLYDDYVKISPVSGSLRVTVR